MVTVAEAIAEGTRGIRALEPVVVDALLTEYDIAWHAVERNLLRYERQIQAAIDAGVEPRPSWLRQQIWWRQMEASIEAEMARFDVNAARILAHGQREAVGISTRSATLLTDAVGVRGAIVPRVSAGAMERWVSAMRPGSPVRRVIDGYEQRVAASLRLRMSEGIGSGKGITGILRDVRGDVGPDAVRGRVHTFVRTEVQRSFRGTARDLYASMPDGMITGYRWQASLSARTCVVCISLHGTVSQSYRMDQHPSCRCTQIPIVGPRYAPPRQFGETGPEWFARQDEATQRRMFNTQAHYDLYRQGVPLPRMVGIRQSRVWGPSVTLRPASALRGAA